jgi:hypothetical protein
MEIPQADPNPQDDFQKLIYSIYPPPPTILPFGQTHIQYLLKYIYGAGGGGIEDQKPKKGLKEEFRKGCIKIPMQLFCKCGLMF